MERVRIGGEPERAAGLPESIAPTRARWLRPAVWGVATAGLAVGLSALWLENFPLDAAVLRGDYAGVSRVLDRLAWFGRDNSEARVIGGRAAAQVGDWEVALANYQDAFEMAPDRSELLVQMARANLKL